MPSTSKRRSGWRGTALAICQRRVLTTWSRPVGPRIVGRSAIASTRSIMSTGRLPFTVAPRGAGASRPRRSGQYEAIASTGSIHTEPVEVSPASATTSPMTWSVAGSTTSVPASRTPVAAPSSSRRTHSVPVPPNSRPDAHPPAGPGTVSRYARTSRPAVTVPHAASRAGTTSGGAAPVSRSTATSPRSPSPGGSKATTVTCRARRSAESGNSTTAPSGVCRPPGTTCAHVTTCSGSMRTPAPQTVPATPRMPLVSSAVTASRLEARKVSHPIPPHPTSGPIAGSGARSHARTRPRLVVRSSGS